MKLDLIVDPNITGKLKEDVGRANRILVEEVLKRARGPVRAEWSLGSAPTGDPLLTLKLTDHTDTEQDRQFSPEAFRDENWLAIGLHRLWGDVLEKRWDRLYEPALSSANGEQGGYDGQIPQ